MQKEDAATCLSERQLRLGSAAWNLLNRNFVAPSPNRVWAGDITFIATREG